VTYFGRMGIWLPLFMTLMAAISLSILWGNVQTAPDQDHVVIENLFLIWGALMATGAICALLGHRLGLHIFAVGAFGEALMILVALLMNFGGVAGGGLIVGIMPLIAYFLAGKTRAQLV